MQQSTEKPVFSIDPQKMAEGDSPRTTNNKKYSWQRPKVVTKQEKSPRIENQAPESPDPSCNHRSKVVYGISPSIKEKSATLREEQERLREIYFNNKAEQISKHGEFMAPSTNYNDWC